MKKTLPCRNCERSVGSTLCEPVAAAILKAVRQPGLNFEMRYDLPDQAVAGLALDSMIVGDAAQVAGTSACTDLFEAAQTSTVGAR